MSNTPITDEIIKYCDYQFPATQGHIPLRTMIEKIEKENAELRKALEFVVAAYKEEDWPYVMADNFYAVSCVARIALNGKEAQP